MIQQFDDIIANPARLAALRRLGLLDTAPDRRFDHLTRLASKLLSAPIALLSLIDHQRQFLKSAVGLSEPWASIRELPLSHSLCQQTLIIAEPLVIADAHADSALHAHLAVEALGIGAYAGVPLILPSGETVGVFSVIDTHAHTWTATDLETLQDLAEMAVSELEMAGAVVESQHEIQALQKDYDFMAAALDTVGSLVIVLDRQGHLMRFNRACELTTGYTFDEVRGQPFWEIFLVDEEVKAMAAAFAQLHPKSLPDKQHTYWLTKHGDRRLIAWANTMLVNDHGETEYVISTGIDITEHKQAEEALQVTEARLGTVITSAPILLFAYDRNGIITLLEGKGLAALELQPNEVVGQSIFEVYREIPQLIADAERLLQGDLSNSSVEVAGLTFEVRYAVTRDPAGEIVSITGVATDVTERKRAEEAVQQANIQLKGWVYELEERTRTMTLLNEMGDLLQTCLTLKEAYTVIGKMARQLFPVDSGALCVRSTSGQLFEAVSTWGDTHAGEVVFAPDDCWALRRGRVHIIHSPTVRLICRHFGPQSAASAICVPIMAQGEAMAVLHIRHGARRGTGPLSEPGNSGITESHQQLAITMAEHIGLALANLRLQETLRSQAIRDPLTGLFNRPYMEECLDREIYRVERRGLALGIIMVDIDQFNVINETYGRAVGDMMLRKVGEFFQMSIRREDIACRYRGEEFVIVLPETSFETTWHRAQHLRNEIKQLHLQHNGRQIGPLTLSIGIATYPEHGSSGDGMMRAAESAVYHAQRRGGDRVVAAEAEPGVEPYVQGDALPAMVRQHR